MLSCLHLEEARYTVHCLTPTATVWTDLRPFCRLYKEGETTTQGLMGLPPSPYVLASWTSFLTLDLCVDILGHRVRLTGMRMCKFSFFSVSFYAPSDCWRVCSFTVSRFCPFVCCILSVECICVYVVLTLYK